MTLREHQSLFAVLIAEHITWLYSMGYEVAIAYALRSSEENRRIGGARNSLHLDKLAVDLDLFRDGEYLRQTEDHRVSGAVWKLRHPLCRWGGDFRRPDGNHYGLSYQGRA